MAKDRRSRKSRPRSRSKRNTPKHVTEVKRWYQAYREMAEEAGINPWSLRIWAGIELGKNKGTRKERSLRKFLGPLA